MKPQIKITEVGPRDGLQNEKTNIPTSQKLEFINLLIESGIKNIEVTSFVKPSAIPQLSDSLELSKLVNFNIPVSYSVLTPNIKGYENAIKSGYKEVAIFTAASESFTKKNINQTIEESIQNFKQIIEQAHIDKIKVRGYISTVFACPYEGKINPEKVLEISKILLDLGVYEVSLGETIGVAVPAQVEKLLHVLFKNYSPALFAGHFHDTYGMAIANVNKSLELGLTSFDSSAGGLGGCPYAPGAAGNLATEDLVYLLENSGYKTNVDLNKLIKASRFMESILKRNLVSKTYMALNSKCN